MSEKKQYIGKRLIVAINNQDEEGLIKRVIFKKGEHIDLPAKTVDLIITEDVQDGEIHEIIQQKLALQFLEIMSEHAIPITQIEGVLMRVTNTANNKLNENHAKLLGVDNHSKILVGHIL